MWFPYQKQETQQPSILNAQFWLQRILKIWSIQSEQAYKSPVSLEFKSTSLVLPSHAQKVSIYIFKIPGIAQRSAGCFDFYTNTTKPLLTQDKLPVDQSEILAAYHAVQELQWPSMEVRIAPHLLTDTFATKPSTATPMSDVKEAKWPKASHPDIHWLVFHTARGPGFDPG